MKKTTAMILSLALLALLLAGCGGAESTGQTDGDAAGAETQNTSTEPMDTAASQASILSIRKPAVSNAFSAF